MRGVGVGVRTQTAIICATVLLGIGTLSVFGWMNHQASVAAAVERERIKAEASVERVTAPRGERPVERMLDRVLPGGKP